MIISIMLAVSSAVYAGQDVHWGYEPGNGPASWGKLNKDWRLCAEGDQQSPIDLTGAKQKNMVTIARSNH